MKKIIYESHERVGRDFFALVKRPWNVALAVMKVASARIVEIKSNILYNQKQLLSKILD